MFLAWSGSAGKLIGGNGEQKHALSHSVFLMDVGVQTLAETKSTVDFINTCAWRRRSSHKTSGTLQYESKSLSKAAHETVVSV